MKRPLITAVCLLLTCLVRTTEAQTLNWNAPDSARHIVSANFGLDYGVSFGLGYGYRLRTTLPIVLNAKLSMPSGHQVFDDFKTEIGGQIRLLNYRNFVGALSIYGIYRRYETDFVRLQNFGSNLKGTFGYYKPRWFVAAEVSFDKAIVTHFKHSQAFRNEVYADVADGWYEPATGGNFLYGLQGGYTLGSVDLTLNLGRVITQDFSTSPLLPFYAAFGVNVRLK